LRLVRTDLTQVVSSSVFASEWDAVTEAEPPSKEMLARDVARVPRRVALSPPAPWESPPSARDSPKALEMLAPASTLAAAPERPGKRLHPVEKMAKMTSQKRCIP
jgi:hypothetical protein